MATVSVVMPAYNVAAYIGAAIDSVKAQTVADWELLVVDDGSTDATYETVRRLAAGDARIRLLQKSNGGISTARNMALAVSRGDFIAILDSDDIWEPTYLAEQLAVFDAAAGSRHRDRQRLVSRQPPERTAGAALPRLAAATDPARRSSPTKRRSSSCRCSAAGSTRRSAASTRRCAPTRTTTSGCAPRSPASASGATTGRSATTAAATTASRRSTSACSRGILRVYRKLRPLLQDRPAELRTLDAQVARFERESLAAHARIALTTGDTAGAASHLSALYAQGGGPAIAVASFMARRMPRLLARAYQWRRAYHGAM